MTRSRARRLGPKGAKPEKVEERCGGSLREGGWRVVVDFGGM